MATSTDMLRALVQSERNAAKGDPAKLVAAELKALNETLLQLLELLRSRTP